MLERARAAGIPVFHVRHDAGPGSPYDVTAPIGQISDEVARADGEAVVTKAYPSAFVGTDLEAQLKAAGVEDVIVAGFMTHMCVNSTARSAFSLGFRPPSSPRPPPPAPCRGRTAAPSRPRRCRRRASRRSPIFLRW